MYNKNIATYIILVIVQMFIFNYLNLSQYVLLSILPVIIYLLPAGMSTLQLMSISFLTGIVIDFLSDGVLGLNALALTPVGFARPMIFKSVIGEETLSRRVKLSVKEIGLVKVTAAILMLQCLYLSIYIWTDSASLRPISFNLSRFAASLIVGTVVSIPLTNFAGIDTSARK